MPKAAPKENLFNNHSSIDGELNGLIINLALLHPLEIVPLAKLKNEDSAGQEVFRVDYKECKQAFAIDLLIEMDVSKFNTSIEKIRCYYNSDITALKDFYFFLNFRQKDGIEVSYYVRGSSVNELLTSLLKLAEQLPEACVEKRFSKFKREHIEKLPSEFWSSQGGWTHIAENVQKYVAEIDPATVETFKKIISKKRQEEELVVIDVGGGKGRLAKQLLAAANQLGYKINYILIEPDESQCQEAVKNFSEINGKKLILNGDLEAFRDSSFYAQYKGKADIIISSGGPINVEVVSYNEAKTNMHILKELLNKDGTIIATGMSLLALKKKQLENYGFTVFSTTKKISPENEHPIVNLKKIRQLYVMKKK